MDSKRRRPRTTWPGRFLRGRRLDRNPLRRSSDRAETLVLALLVAVFLAAAPIAALTTRAWAYTAAHRAQVEQEASRHQVPALVLKLESGRGSYAGEDPEAQARWRAPGGTLMTGEVSVPPGTLAGATVRLWVTSSGQPAETPLLDSQVSGLVSLAEAGGVCATALMLAIIGLVARRVLDRRRLAAWEADWRSTSPGWTTPRA